MRAILFDMDGVLYNSIQPIEGAAEALAWVREQGIPHLFVTNTSSHGRAWLVEKLIRFGIQVGVEQVLTPPAAAAEWLRTQDLGPVSLFVPPSAGSEFAGLDLLPENAEQGARFVVIGDLGERWDFRTLNRAFRLLHESAEAELIALGMTKFWQTPEGLCLDVAPFAALLEHATGKRPMVFGKPSERFFQAAAERFNIAPGEIVMIGDDIEIDVTGAQNSGMKGVLVRTGKFRPPDLERGYSPDAVLDSIAALPLWWGREQ